MISCKLVNRDFNNIVFLRNPTFCKNMMTIKKEKEKQCQRVWDKLLVVPLRISSLCKVPYELIGTAAITKGFLLLDLNLTQLHLCKHIIPKLNLAEVIGFKVGT